MTAADPWVMCPDCGGAGATEEDPIECRACQGTGEIPESEL